MFFDQFGNLLVNIAAQSTTVTVQELIASYIALGQGYSAQMQQFISAGNQGNYHVSVFNPANSGKTLLIYSLTVFNGTGGPVFSLYKKTADPAYNSAITPINNNLNGAIDSVASATYNAANTGQAGPGGTPFSVNGALNGMQMLQNNKILYLPPTVGGLGIVLDTFVSNANVGVTVDYIVI